MASFTGVGDNTVLTLTHKNEQVDIDISGTYNMTIAFQREVGSVGSGSFQTVEEYTTANATVAETYYTKSAGERVRLIVLVDTSGTATATLTNAAEEVLAYLDIKDEEGNVKIQFDQGGVLIPEDLDVTGDVAVTGTHTVTGLSTLAADLVFSQATPEIRGGDADGELFIAPSTTNALGGNVVLYGQSHATKAGDIEFRNTGTLKLNYDLSALKWVLADDLHFSVANPELLGADVDGALFIGPDTTNALGGNVVLYGSTHATKANDIELRATATAEAHYDDSTSTWDFQANDVATTGNVSADDATFTGEAQALNVPSSDKAVIFDDFHGTWLITDAGPADLWGSTAGSGITPVIATTVSASINGEVTMKSASDDGTNAANNVTFTGINLGYKANKGGLAIEVRVQLDDIVEAYLFVGFTDVIHSTVESPITFTDGTDTLIADANDACGIVFTGDSTTQKFAHGGVKATAVAGGSFSGSAPVNGTYVTLRVEVSATGGVRGFVDGVAIGAEVANAITATTAVTPAIIVGNTAAAQTIATIDYIRVEQNR